MANSLDKFRKGVARWSGNIGSAGISDAVVKTVPLASTSGLPTDTAVMITVNRVDTNGKKTGNYEGIVGVVSGSNLIDCIRGVEGTAQAWTGGTVVEVLHTASNINELIDGILAEHNQDGTHKDTLVTSLKATGAEITTGTEDAKIVTPKAIADSTIAKSPASATENAAGTDNTKFITALANVPAFLKSLSANCIINAGFTVNQRGYVSNATLAAGVYGHDRWKAGAGGGDYTFTQLPQSTTITIKSGKSLIQVIEDKNVIGGTYTLSWTGTAQARFGINSATPSGAYAASPITITTQTAGTVMSVEFNEGTLGKVVLNSGDVALPFMPKSFEEELRACQRYFIRYNPTFYTQVAPYAFGTELKFILPLPVEMRVAPTTSVAGTRGTDWILYNGDVGGANTTGTFGSVGFGTKTLGFNFSSGTFTAGANYFLGILGSGYLDATAEL